MAGHVNSLNIFVLGTKSGCRDHYYYCFFFLPNIKVDKRPEKHGLLQCKVLSQKTESVFCVKYIT